MDYTLFGKPLVDTRIIRVRATVIEEPKSRQISLFLFVSCFFSFPPYIDMLYVVAES